MVATERGEHGAIVLIRAEGDWQLEKGNATVQSKFNMLKTVKNLKGVTEFPFLSERV